MADRKTTRKKTPKAVSKGKRKAAVKKAAVKKASSKKSAKKTVKKTVKKVSTKKSTAKKTVKKAVSKKAAPKAAARKKAPVKRKLRPRKVVREMPVPRAISVGDAVMLPAGVQNQIRRYDAHATLGGRGTEAVSGLVCSIRQVATGKFTAKTRGDLKGYVLEILHSRTFQLEFSSETNTGGAKGPEAVSDNPSWSRLQNLLRQQAESKQLASYGSGGFAREVFGSLLDGWRLVKVKAEFVLRED